MTLRSTAREECRTVLLVKPFVKVTRLAFFKVKSKVNGKNRVASDVHRMGPLGFSGHVEISSCISQRES